MAGVYVILAIIGAMVVWAVFMLLFVVVLKDVKYLSIVFMAIVAVMVLFMAINFIASFFGELRRVQVEPTVRFDTRSDIEDFFVSLTHPFSRTQFVRRLEIHHRKNGTKPSGLWSRGAAPNVGDRASIRLSQLDEIWSGLER